MQRRAPIYDKTQDGHYNLISALHKSVRGSDPDAALYYLAACSMPARTRSILARRVVRMAVEDIGLADPQALAICNAAKDAYDFLGSPEGELALAQAVVYFATAPKSNAVYTAFGAAMRAAKENGSLLPPKHILNAPTKLMKGEGYGRATSTTTTRRRPSRARIFPGEARPSAILRSARARLRARDQQAAGLLGEAAQGAGRGVTRELVLVVCARWRTPALAAGTFYGRWALNRAACAQDAVTGPLVVSAQALQWPDTVCRVRTSYRVGDTWHIGARCPDAASDVPVGLQPRATGCWSNGAARVPSSAAARERCARAFMPVLAAAQGSPRRPPRRYLVALTAPFGQGCRKCEVGDIGGTQRQRAATAGRRPEDRAAP